MNNEIFVWKRFALILLVGLTPIFIIFLYFKTSTNSHVFEFFLDLTKNINANISSTNLELTKPLSIYCKLAPLLSLYFVVKYSKQIKLKPQIKNKSSIIFNSIGFSIVYFIMLYIFVFGQFDMVNGNRLLKATASNDYSIIFYYVVTFSGLYCLSFMFIALVIKLPSELKKTRHM